LIFLYIICLVVLLKIHLFIMKIHCVGIGGIGLSGLARLLKAKGHTVTGSDIENSEILDELKEDDLEVFVGHNSKYITEDIDQIIYSTAVPLTNDELVRAKELNIKLLTYAEGLKEFTKDSYVIAITGTHGKTSTTAFSGLTFLDGLKDPTILVGSKMKDLDNKNCRIGESKYFIAEACEYQKNFLQFYPNVIILTNIEAEHLDYFQNLDNYKKAFVEFLSQLKPEGYVIANYEDENVCDVVKTTNNKVIYFASEFFEHVKTDLWYLKEDKIFNYKSDSGEHEYVADLVLQVPGDFNKMNALAAFICAYEEGIDVNLITKSLQRYSGSWRRMEEIGDFSGVKVISDYGHHPTEIKVTLDALKEKYGASNICCVYQPHQFNRTKHFLKNFPDAFSGRTKFVIVPDIYKVRDEKDDVDSVSDDKLVELINESGTNAFHIHSYEKISDFIKDHKDEIDLIVIMGAGDIYKLAYFLAD